MKKLFLFALALFCFSTIVTAQPRPVDTASTVQKLPPSFAARYEGGIFGSSRKENGVLKFDDANERVVFFRKDGKEMFSIPYATFLVVYPDSKTSSTRTGNVISHLPLPGAGLAGLMSKKRKYLVVNFEDPDVEVNGTANFKFEDRDDLLTFIHALGSKAKMTQRGEAYYRPRERSVY
jgi:hypothetical protein